MTGGSAARRADRRAPARTVEAKTSQTARRGERGAGASAVGSPRSSQLEATLQLMREEVLASVARIGGRLGELRLDTDLDISHGVVRYLELLKLAALLQRPPGRTWRMRSRTSTPACSRRPRRCSARSSRPRRWTTRCWAESRSAAAIRARIGQLGEPSLGPFLPRKGIGLALSASDIETYRSCPLQIQVRARAAHPHRADASPALRDRRPPGARALPLRRRGRRSTQMLACSTPAGAGAGSASASASSSCGRRRASALTRYHERLAEEDSQPVWFERPFAFRLGPHHLRGRVDRVDRLGGRRRTRSTS